MGSAGPSSLVRLFGYPCGRLPTRTHACLRRVRVLVVGLGVDRIVDASLYCGCSPPGFPTHTKCVVCGGVVVCVGLLVPVSSQTVAGLPLLAYQPSSLLGAYQKGQVLLAETLS